MGVVFFAGASETATLTNTFTVTTGGVTTATDPTTVTLLVTDPTGNPTTYTWAGATITRVSAGVFTKDISCSIPGEWEYVWTGTGTVPDVNHGTFTVFETNLGHLYVTPQMLRSRVGLSATDSSNDLELHYACYAASRYIESYCSRFFWRTLSTEVRVFETKNWYNLDFGPFNDVVSVTSFKTDTDGDGVFETTWATTDYELGPQNVNSGPEARPYTTARSIGRTLPINWASLANIGRRNRVQVTGVFGWPAVPMVVGEAARVLAADFFKSKDAPFGTSQVGEHFGVRAISGINEAPFLEKLLNRYRHGQGYVV